MKETFMKGIVGTAATSGSVTISLLSQVEQWLRIASLLVGISIGIVTLISLLKHKKKHPKKVHGTDTDSYYG